MSHPFLRSGLGVNVSRVSGDGNSTLSLSQNSLSATIPSAPGSTEIAIPDSNVPTPWVRNKAWPTYSIPEPTDQKVIGLYAVMPGDEVGTGGNWFSVNFSGAYTVDYGDGNVVNYSSGAKADYQFNWSNPALTGSDRPVTLNSASSTVDLASHPYVNGDPVRLFRVTGTPEVSKGQVYYVVNSLPNSFQISTTPGGIPLTFSVSGTANMLPYKIAIVSITPQAGNNLTTVSLAQQHSLWASVYPAGVTSHVLNWLELNIALPNCTSLQIGTNGNPFTSIAQSFLESINFVSNGPISSMERLLISCSALRKIVKMPDMTGTTNTTRMFSSCTVLEEVPEFQGNLSSLTTMTFMFELCYSLLKVAPISVLPAATDLSSMFANCISLGETPTFLGLPAATNISSMFSNCSSLQKINPFPVLPSVTNAASLFASCRSLEAVPNFPNMPVIQNMSSMFSNCSALKQPPVITNMNTVTNLSGFYSSCSGLREIPPLPAIPLVTNLSAFLSSCSNLMDVPDWPAMPSVTNLSSLYSGCTSLENVPSLPAIPNVTNLGGLYAFCTVLKSVPDWPLMPNVTSINGVYQSCTSLLSVPNWPLMPNVTDISNVYRNCYSMETVPKFPFLDKITNCSSLFENCYSLRFIPDFEGSFSNVTNMGAMFKSCVNLEEAPKLPGNFNALTNITEMFFNCTRLNTLELPYPITNVTSSNNFARSPSITRILIQGITSNFIVYGCPLSATALNEIFTNLPSRVGLASRSITITACIGIWQSGLNTSIATAKNWTVVT